eukprot:Clim_evm11s20 gene=Clim_evmTU11s20
MSNYGRYQGFGRDDIYGRSGGSGGSGRGGGAKGVTYEELEQLIDHACQTRSAEPDWNAGMQFCDLVAMKPGEGSRWAASLIIDRVRYGNEQVALNSLQILQACVNNCGRNFHRVIGQFKFLNELIKQVSRKYYNNTPEPVRRKILEVIQQCAHDLKHEPKIQEAYEMLKRQGCEFPMLSQESTTSVTAQTGFLNKDEARRKNSVEYKEKNKLLGRLLKSTDPEDLKAANLLIKEMVEGDANAPDETDKKIREDLNFARNNITLLRDMLSAHNVETDGPLENNELIQEFYKACTTIGPKLARLITELEEEEDDISEATAVMQDLSETLGMYEAAVEGKEYTATPGSAGGQGGSSGLDDQLIDFGFDDMPAMSGSGAPSSGPTGDILGDQLSSLGLGGLDAPMIPPQQQQTQPPAGLMGGIMGTGAPTTTSAAPPATMGGSDLLGMMGGPTAGATTAPAAATKKPSEAKGSDPFAGLFGGPPASSATGADPAAPTAATTGGATGGNSMDLLGDLMGGSTTPAAATPPVVPTAAAAAPAAVAANGEEVRLYKKRGLVITAKMEVPANAGDKSATLTFTNKLADPMENFVFQAAVPKSMKLRLEAPSGTTLPAYSPTVQPITQRIHIEGAAGQSVPVRFKLSYTCDGDQEEENAEGSL